MVTSPSPRPFAGMLAPVFAMRHANDFGIGDTAAVRQAIVFCARHRMGVLQLLPIHETFADPSPYNPITAMGLSPSYVSLAPEDVPGLTQADLDGAAPGPWLERLRSGIVKHGIVHILKMQVLRIAHHRFRGGNDLLPEFETFVSSEAGWLRPYCVYRALIREYEGNPQWQDWRPEHQTHAGTEHWLSRHPRRAEHEDAIEAIAFAQWVAARQWRDVKRYAETRGVRLMGEIAFGVGRASADVWSHPDLFDLDWSMGTPPLAYFDTSKDSERWGQNWGFPPYRWENHRATGFAWLKTRMRRESEFFHLCRIDHLRGYFRAYMFPWAAGPKHAGFADLTEEEAADRTGGRLPRFIPGPDDDPVAAELNRLQGSEILTVLKEAAGGMELVGEIMGDLPESVRGTLDALDISKLVFPQLDEATEIPKSSLIAYGNHDHAPLAMLIPHLLAKAAEDPAGKDAANLSRLLRFLNRSGLPEPLDDAFLHDLQKALLGTPSRLAILMCSDIFGIPLRFNLPGSYGLETWCERLEFSFPEYEVHPIFGSRAARLREIIRETGRC